MKKVLTFIKKDVIIIVHYGKAIFKVKINIKNSKNILTNYFKNGNIKKYLATDKKRKK